MWTIKHIYESDFGCEERMPGEPLTVIVTLESDDGDLQQLEVADQWLTLMDLNEGDEWPEEFATEETKAQNKYMKQSEWMDNYFNAVDEYTE